MLVANVTDWWVDKPALQLEADPATSTIQTIAGTQDSPTTTTDAPPREEIAAAVEPAEPKPGRGRSAPGRTRSGAGRESSAVAQSQAENSQPVTEELFKQFQAWAAEEETREQAGSAQAAPVRVAQDGPAQARPAKKHRRVHSVQNARAEIRPQRHHRARVRRGTRCTGTGPARGRPPRTGPVRAKCAATVVPAKPRFSLGLAGIPKGARRGRLLFFRSSGLV